MSNGWAGSGDSFAESLWTGACRRGAHQECPHLSVMGGGFNRRRLRPEFGAGLCPCSCHASCPVTPTTKRLTVPFAVWRESCTCLGAAAERHRLDEAGVEFPDFGDMLQEARSRSRARREAFETVRARAAGESREEIRETYVAELQARGLRVPGDDILDAVVDRVLGNPLPAARVLGTSLAQMGKGIYDISRLFRQRR